MTKIKAIGKISDHKFSGDAGYDLISDEGGTVKPHSFATFKTKIRMLIPKGFHGQVKPRSGLMIKGVLAGEGVVDSGYTGCIHVTLFNHSYEHFEVRPGDRIAQLLIMKHEDVEFEIKNKLPETERKENCFGSTGMV